MMGLECGVGLGVQICLRLMETGRPAVLWLEIIPDLLKNTSCLTSASGLGNGFRSSIVKTENIVRD